MHWDMLVLTGKIFKRWKVLDARGPGPGKFQPGLGDAMVAVKISPRCGGPREALPGGLPPPSPSPSPSSHHASIGSSSSSSTRAGFISGGLDCQLQMIGREASIGFLPLPGGGRVSMNGY